MSEIKLPTDEEIKQSWNTFVCKGKYSDTLFYEAGAIWMRDTYVLPLLEENTILQQKLDIAVEALKDISESFEKRFEIIRAQQALDKISELTKEK